MLPSGQTAALLLLRVNSLNILLLNITGPSGRAKTEMQIFVRVYSVFGIYFPMNPGLPEQKISKDVRNPVIWGRRSCDI